MAAPLRLPCTNTHVKVNVQVPGEAPYAVEGIVRRVSYQPEGAVVTVADHILPASCITGWSRVETAAAEVAA